MRCIECLDGLACPALFCRGTDLLGFCHGDDFCVAGCREEMESFGEIISGRFEVRKTGHIGFDDDVGKEFKLLNRTVRVDVANDRMEVEADEKHVQMLLHDLELQNAKTVATPRIGLNAQKCAEAEASDDLSGSLAALFRSGVMRCAYLGQDRVDVSEAVKGLSRHMARPKAAHLTELKRLARYLKGNRRCALLYDRQDPLAGRELRIHVDSDWEATWLAERAPRG